MQGWTREGILPFTRKQLWELQEQNLAASALSRPRSTSILQEAPQAIVRFSESSTAASVAGQQQPQGQQPALPQTLVKAVKAVQEGLQTAQVMASFSKEHLLEYTLHLQKKLGGVMDIVRTQGALEEMEDDDAEEMLEEDGGFAGRITARNLWGLEGSVTGEEALAIARRRAEDKRQQEAEKASRAADRDAKRRQAIAYAACRAEELIEQLKQGGAGISHPFP